MDFASVLNKSEPHQRTIIHLDMDYYYAQVEEIRDPSLRTQPLGIQQKNIVVTCNYIARQFGVTKLMLISEAKRLCPTLVLVKGEDLTPYRQMSQRIFDLLLNYTPVVEKLGMDENFMDVTALVESRRQQMQQPDNAPTAADDDDTMDMPDIVGHICPADAQNLNACVCGCAHRLAIGTQIAKEMREDLYVKLGITCCAGISYNKLLAKLVGAQNKPNQQTVLVSSHTEQFMRDLKDLFRITGIGQKTESLLLESGIANVAELQQCDMDFLRKKFGFETATKLKELSFGRDSCAVRTTGKPKSIGLEDSCRPISVCADIEDRFRLLLMRLMEQVAEDGRIPIAIKVVLRKFDVQKKTSHRETKQANILPSLFKASCTDSGGPKVTLVEGAQDKLLKIVMRMFERVVDLSKPFNITLIGLAFSKFQQRKIGSSSIANFLIKKTDLEVQSITSLTNIGVLATSNSPTPSVSSTNSDEAFRSSPTTFQPSDQFYRRRTTASSPIPMLLDNGSESAATNSDFSDFSETEVEPSPKKSRLGRLFMAKRRCLGGAGVCSNEACDVASPSKLRVCDLRLNSRDSEKEFPSTSIAPTNGSATGVQRFRTTQPPSTLVVRIDRGDGCRPPIGPTRCATNVLSPLINSPLPSPMDESSSNSTPTTSQHMPCRHSICEADSSEVIPIPVHSDTATTINTNTNSNANINVNITTTTASTTTIGGNLSNIPCPAGIDPQVFNELPLDVQSELITSWRNSLAVAVANVGNVSPLTSNAVTQQTATAKAGGTTASASQKNTLYRYFLRNK